MPENRSFFKQNQLVILSLVVVFLICGFVYFFGNSAPLFVQQQPTSGTTYSGTPDIGGPFAMRNQHGEMVTEDILQGKNTLMFFGFTHCPDICPMSLVTLTDALEQLPAEKRNEYQVVFVTVDPARDTPELLKEYLGSFDESYIGLSGTEEQLQQMAKDYLVYYARNEDSHPEHYLMDHSAYIYHFDPKGEYVTHYSHKIDPAALATDLKENLTN